MDLIKDLYMFFVNIYVIYAEAIRFVFGIFIRNASYLDFFMVYTSFLIPILFLFRRITRGTLSDSFLNISIHIYLLLMTTFSLIGSMGQTIVFRDINGVLLDTGKGTFFWFLLTLFGIQTIAHKVSVSEMALNRANENKNYRKKKKKRKKFEQDQELNTSTKDLPTEVKEKEQNQI